MSDTKVGGRREVSSVRSPDYRENLDELCKWPTSMSAFADAGNSKANFDDEQGTKETPVRTQPKSEVLGKLRKICRTVAAHARDRIVHDVSLKVRRLWFSRTSVLFAIIAVLLLCSGASAQEPRDRLDAHDIQARQPQLLAKTLARVKPTPKDRAQLYFVGVAGYGGQAVFKREVLSVRELFDQRFSTSERSMALINHRSTLRQFPLATISNLEHVLLHLGQLMDRDRDTLFLFLTSHGERGELAMQLPNVALPQLTPVHLKLMLDRSGIRNRVVVISACHSGSFVPVVADAHTLVITAARDDRSSFGCEDRRHWTYFGDAFFNRAMRHERSFTRAFAEAKRTIAKWETAERLTPSLPQISGGEALGPALAAVSLQ